VAKQPVKAELLSQQQQQQQQDADSVAPSAAGATHDPFALPAVPAVLDPTSGTTLGLALLKLYKAMGPSLGGPNERVLLLGQLSAVCDVLRQGLVGSQQDWKDEFELGYGFVQEAAALGDVEGTRDALCALITSSSSSSSEADQQQQQQGAFALPGDFTLPDLPAAPTPIPGLAVSLALQRLYRGLGAGLGSTEQRSVLLKHLMAVSSALKQGKGLEPDWRAKFELWYGFIQEWVVLRDAERAGKALVALLAGSSMML
jgi:hypothetical protein